MGVHTLIKFKPLALLISLLITLGIGITASLVTRPQIPSWYPTLHKPSFSPPNWLFAPVWTTIYILIAIAAYMVWQRRQQAPVYHTTRWVYIVQLVLNFSWSIVFFGMHQVLGALVVIGLLWLSIVANIYLFGKFSRTAAWLLVPYLLWVSFASMLNLYIYLLN
ncbi:tryptophan-rich sensory protein [Mucilaginibacter sp. Bleaf8]|uniref:TspO/MBR family protein n=1 Tax=Mucilaginibacter sp. Bleaf8 TaxID=2834430 RepID=UPI001BD0C93B|nr:TspO/MBR family protein [Mucilaginibacter sp. Bleaf8]MBS7563573.1 tryptophan-rich sensory protein [Mucilaginibacter sp. Bleaf8]